MSEGSMEQSLKSSHLAGGNLHYLDELYEAYLSDSNSVPNEWRQYFDSLPRVEGAITGDVPHSTIQEQFYSLEKIEIVRSQPVLDQSHPISIVNKFKSSVLLMRIEFVAINVLRLILSASWIVNGFPIWNWVFTIYRRGFRHSLPNRYAKFRHV